MKVSLNWLKQYVDLPAGVTLEEIASRLTFSGLEIEGIEDLGKGFEKIFVGEILERKQHPNADRLSVCQISVGTALSPNGEALEIVCGAQNIKAGDRIPVATLGAIIPNGLEIKAAKIRNVASSGMLCSPEELLLPKPDGHTDGIYQLPKDAPLGKNFGEYLGRDDKLLEVNVTPNRGDALSHLGVAREIAGLFNVKLKTPEPKNYSGESSEVKVINQVGADCPIYFGRLIKGVRIGPSPDWLKKRLESIGLRSINNVVDATSFVLFEAGQPLHAFDAAKLDSRYEIYIREAKAKEKFSSLTGKEVELEAGDLVIASGKNGEKAVALAGVVGGSNSEVSDQTVDVLLECADFNPSKVRKTNRRLGFLTDAAYRFERGVDQQRVEWALNRATDLIIESSGGQVLGTSQSAETAKTIKESKVSLRLRLSDVQRLLGRSPDLQTTMGLLRGIGINAELAAGEQGVLTVQVPGWRRDLRKTVDLVEEVARLWGFDKLEAKLPLGGASTTQDETGRRAYFQVRRLRRHLTSLGFFEALNWGFTSPQEMKKVFSEQELGGMVPVANPLTEDFSVLKTSLLPGLVKNIQTNLANRRKSVKVFEIRRVFRAKTASEPREEERLETGVAESLNLSVALTGLAGDPDWSGKVEDSDFFTIKGIFESVLQILGKEGTLQLNAKHARSYLHPYQSAEILQGKRVFGCVGRLHPRVEKNFDLKQPVYVLEIELANLLDAVLVVPRFKNFSKFPAVERDFSATVSDSVNAQMIRQLVAKEAKPLFKGLEFFDVYRGSRVPEGHVSYAFRITLHADDHTLTDKEIQDVQDAVMKKLASEYGARFAGID